MRPGDLYWADLSPTVGREQSGRRPVLLLSSATPSMVVTVPLTRTNRGWLKHVVLTAEPGAEPSVAMCDQVRSVSVERLVGRIGSVPHGDLAQVRHVLALLLGIH